MRSKLLPILLVLVATVAFSQKKPAPPKAGAPAVAATSPCPAGALHCATLSWTPGSGGGTPTGYNVYRSLTSGGCSTISPLPAGCTKVATNVTLTTYVDSPLAATTTYNYVVTATNLSGTGQPQESAPSNQWTGTTPPDPINPPNPPTGLTGTTQ